MKHSVLRKPTLVTLAGGALLAGLAQAAPSPAAPQNLAGGAVFTATNESGGNEVVAYRRGFLGALDYFGSYSTGGTGTDGGLGSQGALVLTRDGQHLLSVNAGSHDVSLFDVRPGGLVLTDVEPSGGAQPVSVTTHGDLVYVLNAEGGGNISGFRMTASGELDPIADSTRALSGPDTAPAQVSFTPGGDFLVVTERATNTILVYPVLADGRPGDVVVNASEGPTPFGFDFGKQSRLLVSEAAGGAMGASTVSTYEIRPDGTLQTITQTLPSGQSAACWLVTTPDRRFAYVTNTGSDNVTGLAVRPSGFTSLLDDSGITAEAGDAPIDAAVSRNGRNLYVLNAADDTVQAFLVGPFGDLYPIDLEGGLPAGVVGVAAR